MEKDKILKKLIDNPYWVVLIMLKDTWDIVKALWEVKPTPNHVDALADYYKNYNWTNFITQLAVMLILLALLNYLRKVKNEITSLTFHLKAENREFNGKYKDAYFQAVSALKPTFDSKMYEALREQFQIIKSCLGSMPEGAPKLVVADLDSLKRTRELDIEDALKYISRKDTGKIFSMDITQIREDISKLPETVTIQAVIS